MGNILTVQSNSITYRSLFLSSNVSICAICFNHCSDVVVVVESPQAPEDDPQKR